MTTKVPWQVMMFMRAKECADYWREFELKQRRLVLARYKVRGTDKRSRYSLFLFPEQAGEPERCFNFEPDDFPNQAPVAFFGEHVGETHLNYGYAPNDLTIEQFQAKAFEWAAGLAGGTVEEISSQAPKKWWEFWK